MLLPLKLIPMKTSFNFVKYKAWSFSISMILSVVFIIASITHGVNLGVDFTGGTVMEIELQSDYSADNVRHLLHDGGYTRITVQKIGASQQFILRMPEEKDLNIDNVQSDIKDLLSRDGSINFKKVDFVGPKVGQQMVVSAAQALIAAILGILAYIWFRFDRSFGIGAVISTAHDVIMSIGFFIITGYEFDLSSVAAILTIIGYSINDTVVIYDRLRENMRKHPKYSLKDLIDLSLNETFSRTVMTISTTAIVCIALVILGGAAIKGFSACLLFGVLFGTYSSLYIAAPLLLHTSVAKKKI